MEEGYFTLFFCLKYQWALYGNLILHIHHSKKFVFSLAFLDFYVYKKCCQNKNRHIVI